jgi:phosphate starvation-inducible PhoH-like protein
MLKNILSDRIQTSDKKPSVTAKTVGQKKYLDAIRNHDVTFGVGPAGTGKTYLAVAMALQALREGRVSRIILTRPAVEAGEALGFLPGDLYEKIMPYLRPLHDALHDMLPAEEVQKDTERGVIEIAPLAYMRGRTLNHAFIILDEAQNSTAEQMFMFLTRLGINSKAVITGDETQIDLPPQKRSGLLEAHRALSHIEGIAIVEFTRRDVVRHALVQRIIAAYEEHRGKARTPRARDEKGNHAARSYSDEPVNREAMDRILFGDRTKSPVHAPGQSATLTGHHQDAGSRTLAQKAI